MKKLLILLSVFLGLLGFVYFYEIQGQEEREKAKELEESLLRVERDKISSLEIDRPGVDPVRLEREGDAWMLVSPLSAAADKNAVDSLLSSLEGAKRSRTLEKAAAQADEYGLGEGALQLKIGLGDEETTLRLGAKDFTGNQVYTVLPGSDDICLTSVSLLTSLEKEVKEWRSRKVLLFQRNSVQALEIQKGSEQLSLVRRDGKWFMEAPLQEPADESTVNSLLSSLEFGEAENFEAEQAENLEEYGLDKPSLTVRVREEGKETWTALQLGKMADTLYYARDPQRAPVFTVKESLFSDLNKDLWTFRVKDVVDVEQDQIATLTIRRGDEQIVARHEEFKWILEEPEAQKDKEAASYKFWYPIDDLKFESFEENRSFPAPAVRIEATLKDGTSRTFEFAQDGDIYLARRDSSGRVGTISKESFEKLQFKIEDIVS